MSSSDSERTEAAAGVEEERIPRTKTTTPGDRRPSAFTAKDVLEAEELKRTVMSVLEAGGFEGTLSGLDRAWPEVVGGHRPSLAEQLDAERRRDIERQIVQLRRELGVALPAPAATADRTTRSMVVAELQERAATVAARIPELPLPRVDRVPESIVSQTYTKQEGAKKNREACGMCVNCARNEAPGRARRANGDGHGKRRKTSRRPCLTIAAVEMYENNMGYLNGDDMLRIVETMQGGGAGASLLHPHAQIVGLPMVPRWARGSATLSLCTTAHPLFIKLFHKGKFTAHPLHTRSSRRGSVRGSYF